MIWAIHQDTHDVIGPYKSLSELLVDHPEIFRYGPSRWIVVKEL